MFSRKDCRLSSRCLADEKASDSQISTSRLHCDLEFYGTDISKAVPADYQKNEKPTVCYMARLDRRKRPELFLSLAEQFPDVNFIAAGKSRDQKYDQYLRDKYAGLPNLEMTGFIDQFASNRHSEILEQSWIMVNYHKGCRLGTCFWTKSTE